MMNRYYFLFAVLILLNAACKTNRPSANASDKDLVIEAMKKINQDEIVYNVRVFPNKELMENATSFSKDMMYRIDSCFYLSDGLKKVYPLSAEYIPGGVAKSFEYMVTFEKNKVSPADDFVLFYQDKYINKKNYQLLFK
jgi:hypothetical protein